MIKIGITGQQGFVGSHLYNSLQVNEEFELISFKRSFFEKEELLVNFVKQCDVVVHLAAMNRHEDQQVIYDTNVKLVRRLIEACKKVDSSPRIIFSSSTQESQDNLYGKSKLEGGELLTQWATDSRGSVANLVIPNVFGPFCKPFYNSVIATFCHQIINGVEPKIIKDGTVRLIYVNELCDEIISIIKKDRTGKIHISPRHEITVSKLLEKLKSYYQKYFKNGEFPKINHPFDLALFNTFRCYIPHDFYPCFFKKHTDKTWVFCRDRTC